ncbi:TetR/AcrR family transcriptional regulator [Shewanella sp. WXL01]|uniref:TetR/AcrR family transcriptional regulator n=1 Tax=Shewanella maritima TaxID=2520507 RepID=A0A411PGY0_9GAMM|nr:MULTISPECIES: TetR/AcrR family transcriptional regulator [Shewanella]NKF49024.1 TetR/AcrR family transcriptional regulator [Shewanella sp. WXL01]QBF82831.1 TetR/AcrR family transcriptional regulator [Shewanella maritima]
MTTEQKKTRSEIKREAIIEAAQQAFTECGVAATSMDKIAEQAQVSKRTVYNHFKTKEELVMHLVNRLWEESLARPTLEYDADRDLQSQLTELLLGEINQMAQQVNIDVARMAIGHLFYDTTGMSQEMQRLKDSETAILRWIKAAKLDGRLEVSAPLFASEQIWHLMKGHCFWSHIIGNLPPLPESDRLHLAKETALMFLARYQTDKS